MHKALRPSQQQTFILWCLGTGTYFTFPLRGAEGLSVMDLKIPCIILTFLFAFCKIYGFDNFRERNFFYACR